MTQSPSPPPQERPRATTRRTVLRVAGATAVVGGLAAVVPPVMGSDLAASLGLPVERAAPAAAPPAPGSASVVGNIRKFHVFAAPRVVSVAEVAKDLGMTRPVSLREANRRLAAIPTEVNLESVITTGTALGGRARLLLRSDGTYTSSGHMRATGFPSFAYQVTVSVQGASKEFQPTAFHQGRVYGTDTPGDRQRNWNESGRSEHLRQGWLGIAENPRISATKEYNVAGTLGVVSDVAVKIGEFAGLALVAGPSSAALLTLASALDDAVDLPVPHRDWPLGVTVGAGVILVFGPGAIVHAIAAGGIAELAVRTRTMRDEEWAFARKVFGNTLPARERIILTDLLGKMDRRFVMPTVGGRYLVNLGSAAYDNPVTYKQQPLRPDGTQNPYTRPGQLFVHELTHTWQGERWPAVTYFCAGTTESVYMPGEDPRKAWGDYGLEQQATIVDLWYRGVVDSDPFYAEEFSKDEPDYTRKPAQVYDRYVYGNVRAGLI